MPVIQSRRKNISKEAGGGWSMSDLRESKIPIWLPHTWTSREKFTTGETNCIDMIGRAAAGCTLLVDIDRGCRLHITVEEPSFLIISAG